VDEHKNSGNIERRAVSPKQATAELLGGTTSCAACGTLSWETRGTRGL